LVRGASINLFFIRAPHLKCSESDKVVSIVQI
jgi:hypothetical protein